MRPLLLIAVVEEIKSSSNLRLFSLILLCNCTYWWKMFAECPVRIWIFMLGHRTYAVPLRCYLRLMFRKFCFFFRTAVDTPPHSLESLLSLVEKQISDESSNSVEWVLNSKIVSHIFYRLFEGMFHQRIEGHLPKCSFASFYLCSRYVFNLL